MYDVEHHQSVRLAEIHLHGPLEPGRIAFVVFDVHTAEEGSAAQQTARIAAPALDAEVVAFRHLAVGLVLMQAVAATVLVDGHVPVIIAVGEDVQQFGISVILIFGRGPCEVLRRIVRIAGPIDAHFEIGGVPRTRISAELQAGLHGFQLLFGAFEEVVDHRRAPLDPLLEIRAVDASPAAVAVLLPRIDILREPLQLFPDISLEFPAREIREVGLDIVVTAAVSSRPSKSYFCATSLKMAIS